MWRRRTAEVALPSSESARDVGNEDDEARLGLGRGSAADSSGVAEDELEKGLAIRRENVRSAGLGYADRIRWPLSLSSTVLLLLLLFVAGFVAYVVRDQLREEGMGFTFSQCLYKSFHSLERYQKSGNTYHRASDVLHAAGPNSGFGSFAFPTDKASFHNWTAVYDELFAPYVSRDISILEIGVKKGGSIKLWRELFSWNSNVYGMDVDCGAPTFLADARIKVLCLDSQDSAAIHVALRNMLFDIIVDDGCHRVRCQIYTARNLMPLLKSTGVYVVEDLRYVVDNWGEFGDLNSYSVYDDSSGQRMLIYYPKESIAPRVAALSSPREWEPPPSG